METIVSPSWNVHPQLHVFSDPEALSNGAAEFITTLSRKVIASTGNFSIALSGGTTPQRLYTLLGSPLYHEKIDWKQVHIFWADERCVPKDHPESNYKLAFDSFLAHVSISKENIHRIKGEDDPDKAARDYEHDIRLLLGATSLPAFDLIILGAGGDGHTASLFPASAALRERERLAVPVYLEAPNLNRVTLTLPVLNHAVQVLFLVSGKSKKTVVQTIVEHGNPQQYPAGLVHPQQGDSIWFIDYDAASLLTHHP